MVQATAMGNIKVGLPAGVAVPGRVAVDRFAVLVSVVGAGVGRLQVADTAALLVTTVPHNRLAINVLRRGVGRLVHLAQAAAVNGWTWTEVGSVADEITAVTVNPTESQDIRIFK